MLTGKRILLGVTGGIAAYKSAFLVREFVRAGAEVLAVLTNEMVALKALGFNTIYWNYDPIMYANGFTRLREMSTGGGAYCNFFFNNGDSTTNNCFYAMDQAAARAVLAKEAEVYITNGLTHDLVQWWLHDEPGSVRAGREAGTLATAPVRTSSPYATWTTAAARPR